MAQVFEAQRPHARAVLGAAVAAAQRRAREVDVARAQRQQLALPEAGAGDIGRGQHSIVVTVAVALAAVAPCVLVVQQRFDPRADVRAPEELLAELRPALPERWAHTTEEI